MVFFILPIPVSNRYLGFLNRSHTHNFTENSGKCIIGWKNKIECVKFLAKECADIVDLSYCSYLGASYAL